LGLLGAAGSAAWDRTRSVMLAVIAGLWCGSLGILILLSFALTLNLAFEAHAAIMMEWRRNFGTTDSTFAVNGDQSP